MTTKEINSISIREYLKTLGIKPVKEKINFGFYKSPFREDKDPSLKVDFNLNLFFDFGLGKGGSLIDMVMLLNNCTCSEAIKLMENYAIGANISASFSFQGRRITTQTPTIAISKVSTLNHPSLLQYLQYRRIDLKIATNHLKEVHYTVGDKKFFAIAFQNDLNGFEIRNKYFKGGTTPKAITTIDNNHLSCLVFEGFMDYLSFLTLKSIPKPVENVLVLNSVIHLNKATDFLKKHSTVQCYLDNDEAGRSALNSVKEMGISEVFDNSSEYALYKDLNEYLIVNSF